jgi:hypothetical protein
MSVESIELKINLLGERGDRSIMNYNGTIQCLSFIHHVSVSNYRCSRQSKKNIITMDE